MTALGQYPTEFEASLARVHWLHPAVSKSCPGTDRRVAERRRAHRAKFPEGRLDYVVDRVVQLGHVEASGEGFVLMEAL